jgi:DNA end-binding protein Ku
MAPRANWKGYLRLSLVSCPVALYPATSEREKIRFHQINPKTGNRIRLQRVDAETGEPVDYDQIVKGYEVAKGEYIEITEVELEAIALESTRTIDIDRFVPKSEIDDLYNVRPYYIAPDGDIGIEAFAVIRDVIGAMDKVALGRVVLTSREHVIAIEPRDKGLVGTLLRYPYEVRDAADYFDEIPDVKLTKDVLDLARHIVETKTGHFEPERFDDSYENALKELLRKKEAGERIEPAKERAAPSVVNLMDALRKSLGGRPPADRRRPAPRDRRPAAAKAKARTARRRAS